MSKTIAVIMVIFLIASCASKQSAKDIAVTPSPPSAEEEIKKPESPAEKPIEIKQLKKEEMLRVEQEAKDKFVILNFDGADISTVISAIGEMLQMNYILSPNVTGKVTIHSHKKISLNDLFPVFQTILDINGLTAVRDGAVYKIVPLDQAKQQPLSVQSGKEVKMQTDSSFVTQVIPLEYLKASDVVTITRNLMPRGADLIVYEPSNILIVTAPPSGLMKFMKIVEALDIPSTEREAVKAFVYYVENGEAKKLAEILKSLYVEKKGTVKKQTPTPLKPPSPAPPAPLTPASIPFADALPGEVEVEGEVIITPYEDINAIIIKASPQSYLTILEILKKLDIPTKQVLIEVLIAEVSLTDKTQFGIEWMLRGALSIEGKHHPLVTGFTSEAQLGTIAPKIDLITGLVTSILTTPAAGTAFAAIIKPDKYGAVLNAFAGIGKLNVLASPHILAMDNKEAKIEIGDEIPIATGFQQQPSTSTTTGTTSFVAAGQIQYRTTGILLTVTPHISEKNMVKLKISQEISSRGVDISLAGITSPSFTKRKAETIGAVQSGHTLIIGGLISEQQNKSKEGLPFLSRIPLIGHLFGVTTDEVKKTELVIMVTPHVISSPEEADSITKEFQNKVKTIKQRLEKTEKEKAEKE
ncbi:MAG: secretin N-terminal domain-containing protein [Thermodesulfovibrionales bacterium]|nr:secretin N-terminal domain-containing protein [Thermodesulfovibrionales bacterium]